MRTSEKRCACGHPEKDHLPFSMMCSADGPRGSICACVEFEAPACARCGHADEHHGGVFHDDPTGLLCYRCDCPGYARAEKDG